MSHRQFNIYIFAYIVIIWSASVQQYYFLIIGALVLSQWRIILNLNRVCIVPSLSDAPGGPSSFNQKLKHGLEAQGIAIARNLDDTPYDAVLVINATRQFAKLLRCKQRGIPIIQRLGNTNTLHRFLPVGIRESLIGEIRNLMMRVIRSRIADGIVYQSQFVAERWCQAYGATKALATVIYNGVDLVQYSDQGQSYNSPADICILSVEGTQGSDPFDIAIELGQWLEQQGRRLELLMFGSLWARSKTKFENYPFINFRGPVARAELPFYYRGANMFLSTDILTAGCPNSVIEALACGTPVVSYNTGVLPEMLGHTSGQAVACIGNPWKGEAPGNIEGLGRAVFHILSNQTVFRHNARQLAEDTFNVDKMVDAYIAALSGDLDHAKVVCTPSFHLRRNER